MIRYYDPPPRLIARFVSELQYDSGGAQLIRELRTAVRSDGTRDRDRAGLALLGAMACANRAGFRPSEIRRFAGHFVRASLGGIIDFETVEKCARHAMALVDAVYLRFGAAGFATDPRTVLLELSPIGA